MAHGGKREGAGRKRRIDEQLLVEKLTPFEPAALKALEKALDDPKMQHWALPLYFGYMYGKPKQAIDHSSSDGTMSINPKAWIE